MKKNFNFFLFAIILFCIPSVLGLLHNGFPLTDDGNWMVIRFSSFYENLRDGQFPVRFLSRLNHGYGYPVADFLYPGFMYLGSLVHILGFSFVNTIKVIFGISLIASAIFSFLWLRKIFDQFSAFIGALVYLYFPYHLYDIYKRGSAGEILSLAVLPFVLWSIENKNIFLTSAGLSLLVISHNTLALIFIPFIVLYTILRNKKEFKNLFISLILGFGISSFFWIPAIFDLQFTVFIETKISDWSKYFADIKMIGVSTLFILLLIIIIMFLKKTEIQKDRFYLSILILGILSVFFASSFSFIFWNILPVSFIQFPFRVLSLSIPCFALLSALAVSKTEKNKKIILGSVIALLTFFSSVIYLFPASYQYLPDTFYSTNQDTTTVKNEYMPKWVKSIPTKFYESKIENLSGDEEISIEKISPNNIIFNTNLKEKRIIAVNTVYFPGWEASINQKKEEVNFNNPAGIINLHLEKGENKVSVYFTETPIRILSNFISFLSLSSLLILAYLIKYRKFKV
ncbi:MAG: hypothetical protein A2171_00855 [Candidatus Levybacteria bacterium RBG_13_35_9]|nr:MAG: hypothetical protein A2171_00855 [Candidatus Levybacteria bacterium RBG_13_35_9]